MRVSEILNMVFINMFENKFKVLLTSLGIIVGAATIVMVIAIGKGGEAQTREQFADLAADTLYINPDYMNRNLDYEKLPKFDFQFVEQFMEECPSLRLISLRVNLYKNAEVGKTSESMSVCAVTPDFLEVSSLQIEDGENISEDQIDNAERIAIIGYTLAKKEFGSTENAVGQTIKVEGKKYEVVGVLERKGDSIQGLSPDESIFVPYTTAEKYLLDSYSNPQLTARTGDVKLVEQAKEEMRFALEYLLDDGASNFIIEDAGSRIDAATESARTMSMLLVAVATVVFIVGGIGIMNVLFVSVRERTREIGILKALGSRKQDILLQFLLESIMISVCGGVLGIVIGNVALPIIEKLGMRVMPTSFGSIIALLFAVLTGSLFGFYPAYKASSLIPIEALNQD